MESAFAAVARRRADEEAVNTVMMLAGPLAFLVVLGTWLILVVIGFGLVEWPLVGGSLASGLRQAGSSVFTLGFASSPRWASTVADLAAAGTGLVVLTLELAYLPGLYAAYSRREALAIGLQHRLGGRPLSGEAVLVAHLELGWPDGLAQLFEAWESWASDVTETHANYPILAAFRAPSAARSWLWALVAVLDAAALWAGCAPGSCPPQAEVMLRAGTGCLMSLAGPARQRPGADDVDALQGMETASFEAIVGRLATAGLVTHRCQAEAWQVFQGWRRRYAPLADTLSRRLVLSPSAQGAPLAGHGTPAGDPGRTELTTVTRTGST